MVALVSAIAGASFLIFEPILTPRLLDIGMKESILGLAFTALMLTYVIGALIVSMFFTGKIDARYLITFCFVLISIGCLFGGAIISGDSVAETIIGLCIMSFASAGLFIPAIPEAMNSFSYHYIEKQ